MLFTSSFAGGTMGAGKFQKLPSGKLLKLTVQGHFS